MKKKVTCSDSNPRFNDLMFAGEGHGAHSVLKTWNSPVPDGTALSLSTNNMSDRRDAISSLQNLYFTRSYGIVGCHHSLTLLITADKDLFDLIFLINGKVLSLHKVIKCLKDMRNY